MLGKNIILIKSLPVNTWVEVGDVIQTITALQRHDRTRAENINNYLLKYKNFNSNN